jgi:hypothetical protein
MAENLFIFIIESDDFFYNNKQAVYYNLIKINFNCKQKKSLQIKKLQILNIIPTIYFFISIIIISFFTPIIIGYNNNNYRPNNNYRSIFAFTAISKNHDYNSLENEKTLINKLNKNNIKFFNLINKKKVKIKHWAEENISFNINIKTELPMVPISDNHGHPKADGFFDVFKKNQNTQGARIASRSGQNFLYFNPSNPGSSFTTQNAFGFISPSSRIYLKTDNVYWSLYNDLSIHGAFSNNIFKQHYGFKNKITLEYLFYNILKNKVKYKNSLLLNYNYIYNKEHLSSASKIIFPEIVWLFKNKSSTANFDIKVLSFQKNKFSFNFIFTLNDAESTTIKNYNDDLLKQKNVTNTKSNNLFSFASLNNLNNDEINQTMVQQLESDRINEGESQTITNSNFIIKQDEKNSKNINNQSKKQIDLEKRINKKKEKKKNTPRYKFRVRFKTKYKFNISFPRFFFN